MISDICPGNYLDWWVVVRNRLIQATLFRLAEHTGKVPSRKES